ncbi:hypothetical protein [Vibrio parahaemolyticus]|uniref:hypothetical protein n=1 Tax=Vibrio parahaemolyticus TaxID=670 RepID=UPI000DF9BD96|nr:hypothetical protein [Vibrio parahaemolyticus]SUP22619.1 Uncharacterised protein [Vibrio parahaemolyticus]SUP22694.1 Uncharacterised protein [Vibrio parahaemolyticus]
MSWINLSSVTVSNGSTTVTINSGLSTNVKVGDALLIGNEAPVEISGVFATQLILRNGWPNPTATDAAAAVMPTSGEFTTATQALREATNVTQGNFAEMEKWWTQLGTVKFKAYDNTEHEVRTAQQMDADVAIIEKEALELGRTGAADAIKILSHGKNLLLTDDFGNAHHVYRLPIFTFETLNIANCPFTGPLDCFIRQDGSLRPYVDIPIYKASALNSKAVSLPAREPWVSIDADYARDRCEELASNSVMMSFEIRAAIMWIMLSLNFQPTGNTEYGRSHSNTEQFGRRGDGRVPNDRNGSGKTLTGTGPNEWNHDGTEFGIADLVGSAWEWTDGMKMTDGQFIVAEYTGQPEASWPATGVYINESGQFSSSAPSTLNSGNLVWGSMPKAPGYAGNERLQRLMIEPIDCTKTLLGRFYWNLSGERFPIRGGDWGSSPNAGPASLHCGNVRSSGSGVGFRSAFVS